MKTEVKNLRHNFTGEEKQELGGALARAFGAHRGVEAEFEGVRATYKAKLTESEARIDGLSTALMNGFELRDKECFVVFRPGKAEKDFYLTEFDAGCAINGSSNGDKPVLTERMTPADFQQELIEAESIFDHREEIQLFQPAEGDRGILVVGQFAGKWFGAIRVKIGKLELNERLDAEQPCTKSRADAVATAIKRVKEWAKKNLGELAEGFKTAFNSVEEAHKERVE